MNNLEMLMSTALERVKNSSKKVGTYVYTRPRVKFADRPIYIQYALKEKGTMDLLFVTVAAADWIVMLDITWTKEGEIYALDINGEEADSLCPRNIQAVVPNASTTLIENALLWWLTETTFPEQDDEDEYI